MIEKVERYETYDIIDKGELPHQPITVVLTSDYDRDVGYFKGQLASLSKTCHIYAEGLQKADKRIKELEAKLREETS